MSWEPTESDRVWLADEAGRLLDFGARARRPGLGFGWLDDSGALLPGRLTELWVTARMTHCFALGELTGHPGAGELVDHGIAALTGPLQDRRHGGWFAACGPDGAVKGAKEAYGHAFVVLAASSAVQAGHDTARPLLADALGCFEDRLWSEADGMVVDEWDEAFQTLDPYRGLNANMHTVEAFLAAADATGDQRWRERALRVTERVLEDWAPRWHWRLPEHFDTHWQPLPEYNRDRPADPFRPYGATVGHALEWARLALGLEAALGTAPDWLADGAIRLVDRAVADGWHVDGAPGFVYTTDWDGTPVVHERMHWVAAEATAAAATLARRTGEKRFAGLYSTWWDHVRAVFIDADCGSWHHELGPDLRPSATVWSGKPDIYHALQAVLIPSLPLAGSIAGALAKAVPEEPTVTSV